MSNLGDLNIILFDMLEKINDNELKGEELKEEAERAKVVSDLGKTIIDNAKLALSAAKYQEEHGRDVLKLLGEDIE